MANRPPNVKLTKAKIIKYNLNDPNSIPPSASIKKRGSHSSGLRTEDIEKRVFKLKNKLAETNTNLALLRSFVGETIETVKKKKPKSTKDVVHDLKELIVKIDDYEQLNKVIAQRGEECVSALDECEDQKCVCGLNSPSCDEIKNQLDNVINEMAELDDTIELVKIDDAETGSMGFTTDLVNQAKKGLSEVIEACTVKTCINMDKKTSIYGNTKPLTETGMQATNPGPLKRPKLMQTDENPKWDQGTSPICPNICCGENKKKRC